MDGGSSSAPMFACGSENYINGPTGTYKEIKKTFSLTESYYDFYVYLDVIIIDNWVSRSIFIYVNDKLLAEKFNID